MKRSNFVALAFVLAFGLAAIHAAQPEYTNRFEVLQNEALRQDFTIQGEYLAKTERFSMGLHLIADGDGKFRVVNYPGGLPGDGWKAGEPRMLGTAKVEGDEITITMTEGRGTLPGGESVQVPENIEAKGKITIERSQGRQGQEGRQRGGFRGPSVKIEIAATEKMPEMIFEKQFRTSPTFGEQAPEGAVVVFDGTNLDMFEPGAKINEAPQRPGAEQGQRQRPAGFGNTLWAEATSLPFEKKPYKLHVEFMLSYMPTAQGQARSNSGVYIDQSYECQVLDSFGLEGENNECGGFYQVSKPAINMCFPPLTWQTYDFDFTPAKFDGDTKVENARISVKHNGVLIHDSVELPKETPGRLAEGPEPRGVYLQGHGNKVQYRNIWLQYK
ncbi:MAG: DUF1080 domain-containing protein [Planctomycetaceae bacterium]|nr:DUF1080 domain-containing protein [Planctomycetaceae bacterium]